MQQPRPRDAHCRYCRRVRAWAFAGWASDGHENGVRPRSFNARCRSCGLVALVLGGSAQGAVTDAEQLCRTVLSKWLRTQGHNVHVRVVGAPLDDHLPNSKVDFEDALAELYVHLWRLYESYDPGKGLTFASYASHWLPRRLDNFFREAVGRAQQKLHYAAVSLEEVDDVVGTSEDQPGEYGLARAVGRGEGDRPDDRLGDLRWILRLGHSEGAGSEEDRSPATAR